MVRTIVGAAILLGIGLVGYYFVNDRSADSASDKARHALSQAGDTVVDQGLAAAVNVKIASCFGVQNGRFLHTYNDDGKVLIYGLLDPGLTIEQIAAEVKKLPGVKSVEFIVMPRPAELAQAAPEAAKAP